MVFSVVTYGLSESWTIKKTERWRTDALEWWWRVLRDSWTTRRSNCCCCCLVTSVVSDSVWPQRWQPTRLPRPWDSPGKNTGVACHFLLQCMKVKSESEVAQTVYLKVRLYTWKLYSRVRLLAIPWTAVYQAPQSMGFSRQEYWSGVPLPSP